MGEEAVVSGGDDPFDLGSKELMKLVRDREKSGLLWPAYLKKLAGELRDSKLELTRTVKELREKVAGCDRRLLLATRYTDLCSATRGRKERSDKGKPRGPKKGGRKRACGDVVAVGEEKAGVGVLVVPAVPAVPEVPVPAVPAVQEGGGF